MIASENQSGTIHLIGVPGPAKSAAPSHAMLSSAVLCAAAIKNGTTPDASVIVVGGDHACEYAESCGLRVTATIAPPLGRPSMARRMLQRVAGGVDRIICWSDELSKLAIGNADCVELMSTNPDQSKVTPRRFARIICFTDHDFASWSSRGGTPERQQLPVLHKAPESLRGATRNKLGIREPTVVLSAIANVPTESDARGATLLATVLQETGYDITVLVPSFANNIVPARRHHSARGSLYRMIITERSPIEWIAAADFVIVPIGNATGSDACLQSLIDSVGAESLRLGGRGKATLGHAKHEDGSFIDRLDLALERSSARAKVTRPNHETVHA